MIDVALELKKRSHQIGYWIHGGLLEVDVSLFPRTIFHRHEDAMEGVPPKELQRADFPLPDETLILSLARAESDLLVMMNKRYEPMGVDERKHFYYELIRYWHGALKRMKPDMIIFPAVPHTPYIFVIYSLAKLLGIRTVMFDFTRVNDRLLLMNDYKEGSPALKREMQNSFHRGASPEILSPETRKYYEQETSGKLDAVPSDMTQIIGRYSGKEWLRLKLKALWWSIHTFTFFEHVAHFLFKKFWHNLRTEYQSVQSSPDFTKRYIYLPLHYQPECSTSPLGSVFVDQLLMVKTLSESLPEGWFIYVKEHPTQWLARGAGYLSHRYRGYYRQMATFPNVRVIPLETNSYHLIYSARAVATVTGTAGWEAILRSKPALMFGYAWYRDCPGVFRVDGPTSCKAAIRKIEEGFTIDKPAVIGYLAAFEKASVHGYVESYCKELSTLSEKENTHNLLESILSEITKLDKPHTS